MIKITVVFDHRPASSALTPKFGFACLLQTETRIILFDTGSDGEILLRNLAALRVHLEDIDGVFLSHEHWDHISGLEAFLRHRRNVPVFLPARFSVAFKEKITRLGADVVSITGPSEIYRGIFTTGEMAGKAIEQSLVLTGNGATVIVTGCAHPGIVAIVKRAREIAADEVYWAIGGFHLRDSSAGFIKQVIAELHSLDVQKVCPCHCSGDLARSLFTEAYGDNAVLGGAGTVMTLT